MINSQPVDRFTLLHVLSGAVAAGARLSPLTVVTLAIGWEFLERPLKQKYRSYFPHPSQDTFANATLDAGAMIATYYLVRDQIG